LLRVLFKHRFKQGLTEEELENRRVRLLELCYDYVSQTGSLANASGLAFDIMRALNETYRISKVELRHLTE